MMTSEVREDLTQQRTAVAESRAALADALDAVVREAQILQRALRSGAKRPPGIDTTDYLSATTAVARAEETLALATYDLRSAAGEDGFG